MGMFRCACAVLGLLLTIRSSEEVSLVKHCQDFEGGICVTDTECPVKDIMQRISCGKGKVCCIKASEFSLCQYFEGGKCVTPNDCPEEDSMQRISCGKEKVCCVKASDYEQCISDGGSCVIPTDCPVEDHEILVNSCGKEKICCGARLNCAEGGGQCVRFGCGQTQPYPCELHGSVCCHM